MGSSKSPNRLLIGWIIGFSIVGVVASYAFFNLVRSVVASWNVTALSQPSVALQPRSEPTRSPDTVNIPDWHGVERVNILLLGIDPRDTDLGPPMSDTMIVFTIDPASHTASMLSIPRDLWVQVPGYDEGKIDTAYFVGEVAKYPGGGPALAMATVQYNLGIPTQYYIRLDFTAFQKLIDLIGGIDVYVDKTIDDPLYPAYTGNGFDPLHIDAGWQHMDGSLALKYARTRHDDAQGDIGREHRQQQIIMAVRDKVVKNNMLLTLVGQAGTVANTLTGAVQTDLSLDQLIQLAKLATQIDPKNIHQVVIDWNMVLPYVAPTDPPQDVLVPIRDKIRAAIQDQFLGVMSTNSKSQSEVRIKVENGTLTAGLALKTTKWLQSLGFNMTAAASADRFDYAQSRIIDYGDQTDTAMKLAQTLGLSPTVVITMTDGAQADADIVVTLGKDYHLPVIATANP